MTYNTDDDDDNSDDNSNDYRTTERKRQRLELRRQRSSYRHSELEQTLKLRIYSCLVLTIGIILMGILVRVGIIIGVRKRLREQRGSKNLDKDTIGDNTTTIIPTLSPSSPSIQMPTPNDNMNPTVSSPQPTPFDAVAHTLSPIIVDECSEYIQNVISCLNDGGGATDVHIGSIEYSNGTIIQSVTNNNMNTSTTGSASSTDDVIIIANLIQQQYDEEEVNDPQQGGNDANRRNKRKCISCVAALSSATTFITTSSCDDVTSLICPILGTCPCSGSGDILASDGSITNLDDGNDTGDVELESNNNEKMNGKVQETSLPPPVSSSVCFEQSLDFLQCTLKNNENVAIDDDDQPCQLHCTDLSNMDSSNNNSTNGTTSLVDDDDGNSTTTTTGNGGAATVANNNTATVIIAYMNMPTVTMSPTVISSSEAPSSKPSSSSSTNVPSLTPSTITTTSSPSQESVVQQPPQPQRTTTLQPSPPSLPPPSGGGRNPMIVPPLEEDVGSSP